MNIIYFLIVLSKILKKAYKLLDEPMINQVQLEKRKDSYLLVSVKKQKLDHFACLNLRSL